MKSVTPPIFVYGIFSYDRSAKIRWLLNEMDMPYETKWLDPKTGDLEKPEYLRVNPIGRSPAIEIDQKPVFESGAICAYVADRFLDRGLAPKLDTRERSEYQKWMYFAASTLDILTIRMMVIEDIPAGDVAVEKMKSLLEDAHDAFSYLDSVLAKNEFLLGSSFSAADICVTYHVYFCTLWPEFSGILEENGKHILNYLERMKARPSAVNAGVFSFE